MSYVCYVDEIPLHIKYFSTFFSSSIICILYLDTHCSSCADDSGLLAVADSPSGGIYAHQYISSQVDLFTFTISVQLRL